MSCDFAHHDGAYVLGALSPAERQEFEQHLAGCAECSRAVRELAGLPGLLARVDASVLRARPATSRCPTRCCPASSRDVRADAGVARVLTGAVGGRGAVVAGVVPVVVASTLSGGTSQTAAPAATATPPAGRTMIALGGAPVRATVALDPVAWGTRLDLVCTYAPRPASTSCRTPRRTCWW